MTQFMIHVGPEPIHIQELLDFAIHSEAGGTSCFIGTTKDKFNGKHVVQLEYESYIPMALHLMNSFAQKLIKKYSLVKLAIVHRIGVVGISEASLVIVASGVHRKEPIEAVQEALEWVKSHVPIWKKEVYSDGSVLWKENCNLNKCC